MEKSKSLFIEGITMWIKERGLSLKNIPTWVSIIFFVLGVIGIIGTDGVLEKISWTLFSLALFIEFLYLLIIIPNRIYQRTLPFFNMHLAQVKQPNRYISVEPYLVSIHLEPDGLKIVSCCVKVIS
jgi:hypothetical protein